MKAWVLAKWQEITNIKFHPEPGFIRSCPEAGFDKALKEVETLDKISCNMKVFRTADNSQINYFANLLFHFKK